MKDINIKTFTKNDVMSQKYRIEGNFDFYSALKESSPAAVVDESTICLITRMPLTADYVAMECGHKFNYLPLYNGLVQTTKPSINCSFRSGQIACPFCRRSQTTLLPFNPAFKKVIGVNLYPFKIGKDSGVFTPDAGHLCKLANPNECTSDYAYKCGENYYCETHHVIGASIEKQQTSYSIFLAKKEKADKKKAAKEAKKKTSNKVVAVVDPLLVPDNACKAILKYGPRKGEMCLCAKTLNGLCNRHTSKTA
jgi:hypothetical protein